MIVHSASSAPIEVQSVAIPLNSMQPNQSRVEALTWLTGWHISSTNRQFGGVSGFERQGNKLLAVSDKGYWIILDLVFDDKGILRDIPSAAIHPILSPARKPLEGRLADAEELILRPDGRVLVTFEHNHRISLFGDASRPQVPFYQQHETTLPPLPALSNCPENGGLEAATWHPELGLIAIREHEVPGTARYPGWVREVATTRQFQYQGTAPYRPTAMTHLPDGDLITLERHFTPETGPVSRIVRIGIEQLRKSAAEVSGRPLAHFDGPVSRDNFEAIAVGPNVGGRPTLLVGSDDNYASHQRTLLVQVAL